MRNCAACGVSVDEQPLYRANVKGEPGLFLCRACFAEQPPADLVRIAEALKRAGQRESPR